MSLAKLIWSWHRAGCAAALLLGAAGCAPGLLYAPVARERPGEVELCAINQLEDRRYSVTRAHGELRVVGTKERELSFLERLGPNYQDRISVAVAQAPDSSRLLVIGPYRQEKASPLGILMGRGFGGGRAAAQPATRGDAREILAACASSAPLGGNALRCVADGKPLARGELLRVTTATGGTLQATAHALAGDTLTLARGAELLAVPLPEVESMLRLAPVPLYNVRQTRALIGGGVGFILGFAVLVQVARQDDLSFDAAMLSLLIPALGAGIGHVMGAASAGRQDPVWRWREIPTANCRGLSIANRSATPNEARR